MQYVIHVQYVVDNLTRILSTGRVLKVISVNSYSVGYCRSSSLAIFTLEDEQIVWTDQLSGI